LKLPNETYELNFLQLKLNIGGKPGKAELLKLLHRIMMRRIEGRNDYLKTEKKMKRLRNDGKSWKKHEN
jgi:hypothetical protein